MESPSGRFAAFVIIACGLVSEASASFGDRNNVFRSCLSQCVFQKCPESYLDDQFLAPPAGGDHYELDAWNHKEQSWHMKLLLWECEDECKYHCMWKTVAIFQAENISIPQFYGKWPFVRIFGIQEPASAFFSVLNGVAHLWMLQTFVQKVPNNAPMFRIWFVYGLLSINAWFWSAVFHTRDFPFTEKMDYFSALLGVLFSFYAFIIRISGDNRMWKLIVPGLPCLVFYCYHVHYLSFVNFDYGYNMLANVTVGMLNSIGWLAFCAWAWYSGAFSRSPSHDLQSRRSVSSKSQQVATTDRKRRPIHSGIWKCAVSVLAVNFLLSLELLDFPPWFWTFDAHSLWHLGTIPLPLLWYRFLIADCYYLNTLTKNAVAKKV